jgi:bacterial/archaeal transporter family-2 protein
MKAFAIPFLLAVGGLLAVQAGANVQLSAAMRSPFAASTLQLAIGAAVLVVAAAVAGSLGAFGLIGDVRPAELVGGLGSAVYITAGIVLFPRLGAVVTVGFLIAGQMLASLLLDGFGWLGVQRDAPGATELAGALAVVAGAALIVRAQVGRKRLGRVGWLALAVAAGAMLPVQGAINAQLRAALDAPVTVGAISFLVAMVAMAAALLASLALSARRPRVEPLRRVPWWGWLGGLCGATYVTSVFLLIPQIGVAQTVALTVAGQQLASLWVDRQGLLRLPQRPVAPARLVGVAVLFAGVALVQLT